MATEEKLLRKQLRDERKLEEQKLREADKLRRDQLKREEQEQRQREKQQQEQFKREKKEQRKREELKRQQRKKEFKAEKARLRKLHEARVNYAIFHVRLKDQVPDEDGKFVVTNEQLAQCKCSIYYCMYTLITTVYTV
jgi:hypothetical protein